MTKNPDSISQDNSSDKESFLVTPKLLEILISCNGQTFEFSDIEDINNGKLIIWPGIIVSKGYTASGLSEVTIENDNFKTMTISSNASQESYSPGELNFQDKNHCVLAKNLSTYEESLQEASKNRRKIILTWSYRKKEIEKIIVLLKSSDTSASPSQPIDAISLEKQISPVTFASLKNCPSCNKCISDAQAAGLSLKNAKKLCCKQPKCVGCPKCA